MKILHLLSAGGLGGIEVLCLELAKNDNKNQAFCFLMDGGVVVDEIEKNGCMVFRLYQKRTDISKVYTLLKIINEQKYDVIIEHHGGLRIFCYYALILMFVRGPYKIKYLHSAFEKKYYYSGKLIPDILMKTILQFILRKSDMIVGVSNFVINSFQSNFKLKKEKIRLIYNGISTSYFGSVPQSIIKKNSEVEVLYIGRVVEEKGIGILIQAVKRLKEEAVLVRLVIVGDGINKENYRKIVAAYNLEKNIIFIESQLNKETYLKRAQIFVYPSICQEAFGISVVEAMAAGLICVASAVGGIPEIIEDGQDGLLIKEQTVDGVYECLKKGIAICNEGLTKDMCMLARKKARNFTIDKTIIGLQEVYAELRVIT